MNEHENSRKEPDYGFFAAEEQRKRRKKKFIAITSINTVLAYGIYIILMQMQVYEITFFSYLGLLAGFSFGYVFYNRGFSRNHLTEEMLPDSWSAEQKFEYINDGKVRREKSQWCLTIIFPLIFTLFMDIAYLFIYEPYFAPILGSIG